MGEHGNQLLYGPIGRRAAHVCVDMQRLFAEQTDWHTPWIARVLPKIIDLTEQHASQTVFTRFLPAERPGDGQGTWARYYHRWADMTVSRLGRDMIDLVPELARFVPPGMIVDKRVYSPWFDAALNDILRRHEIDTVIISGGETEVCVLATILGAVDRGYRVIVATDALCSSSDETHDAMLKIYEQRYGQQIEAVTTDVIAAHWTLTSAAPTKLWN
jgi:nicotinamidase-related amidase